MLPKAVIAPGFREGQFYPLKLPVETDHRQVTALACADLVLSTRSGSSVDLTCRGKVVT